MKNDTNTEKSNEPQLNWQLVQQFWFLVKPYWQSDYKRQAWTLLSLVVFFIIIMSGVNAYKTYISKWAIDALNAKDPTEFYNVIYLAIISLAISVPIVAFHEYYPNKLSLFWRRWANLELLKNYFNNNAYYKMSLYSDVDNPDQRIAEDLNNFVTESTRFFSILSLSIISIIAYIGVLGSISWTLVLSIFIYALIGTTVIVYLSRDLVKLNFRNIRYQADYRYNLVHVRDNIESIAFYKGEQHERSVLVKAFNILFGNFFHLIKLQRNISFATQAYTLFAALIPFVLLAPKVFAGDLKVGSIVQASTVFMILLTDLSLIINEFKSLSTLAATIQRLYGFMKGLDASPPDCNQIQHASHNTFDFQNVTVFTPKLEKKLVQDLSLTIKPGSGLMIVGASGCGKSSLLRAVAGLWRNGDGNILSPKLEEIMFLPQKPYMLIGTLKEQMIYPHLDAEITDAQLKQALDSVGLNDLVDRVGGLNTVLNWSNVLSLGEQQRVIFLRLFLTQPKFAILDESTSALDEPNEAKLYQKLRDSGITYISVGHRSTLLDFHDDVLQLQNGGDWKLMTIDEYQR